MDRPGGGTQPGAPGAAAELAVDTSNLQFFDPVSALSIGHPAAAGAVAAGEAANA